MSYVDVSQRSDESVATARTRRRSELAMGWKFSCKCPRCEEEGRDEKLDDEVATPEDDAVKMEFMPTKSAIRLES